MTPKRHGRNDAGFQPVLANHGHNAFYRKNLSHRHGVWNRAAPYALAGKNKLRRQSER